MKEEECVDQPMEDSSSLHRAGEECFISLEELMSKRLSQKGTISNAPG